MSGGFRLAASLPALVIAAACAAAVGGLSWLLLRDRSQTPQRDGVFVDAEASIRSALEATHPAVRCVEMIRASKAAFEIGAYGLARQFAEDLLRLALRDCPQARYGDALHAAHIVLGRLLLREGHTVAACEQLLLAGRVEASAVLQSFGPNMSLASELLLAGERESVLEFLHLCRRFWSDPRLLEWTAVVERGGHPDFGSNLRH